MASTIMQSQQLQYPPPQLHPMPYQINNMPFPSQIHMPMQFSYSPSQQPNSQFAYNYRPDWATEILDNMKEMKVKLSKLSVIEQSLTNLTMKFSKLESKVPTMETVVNNCEKSCTFLNSSYDAQSNETKDTTKQFKEAKDNIKSLKPKCDNFEKKEEAESKNKIKIESKITDFGQGV